eukprot:COSAG03_NODE_2173_length_3048_cov_3.062733_4_plen_101_part_01
MSIFRSLSRAWFRYCSQKVALSTTGLFQGEEVVVYDTGSEYGAVETAAGNSIAFEQTSARYLRHWSGRSDRNSGIHFMEIDVYGLSLPLPSPPLPPLSLSL